MLPTEKKHRMVEVIPLAGVEGSFAYNLPEAFSGNLQVGSLVKIPLRNRNVLGIVSQLGTNQNIPENKLKLVTELLYNEPIIDECLLQLGSWMRDYYGTSWEGVFETMIPSEVRHEVKDKWIKYVFINKILSEAEKVALGKRAKQQLKLYEFLTNAKEKITKGELLEKADCSEAVYKGLLEKGVFKEISERVEREVYADMLDQSELIEGNLVELNDEQAVAVGALSESVAADDFKVHLLHGVTGSGKTEVYLRVMEKVLETGGSVIFLVPEVMLAPQTTERVRRRFEKKGHKVVVWHSLLSAGERLDAWMAMVRGEARIVVGARSAIFSPLKNLKLIIVDEEHEGAYKQGESPRYHGRDVAVYRAMLTKAVCVLGSATPSLETLYNVQRGRYAVNRLTKRVDDRELPKVHVVDMKPEVLKGKGEVTLSNVLVEKLKDRFEKKEQSILFINRRGHFVRMLCLDCGYVSQCPHCSVALTLHKADGRLKCHICGYHTNEMKMCPACKSKEIKWRGFGTQRVEDVVQKIIPQAKVVRMDADVMHRKELFREILGDFRKGKIDILVGTQMIAKGLDFPNVTLVGLVDADISLHLQDFRAEERGFQLMVQVAGRAGRGSRAGEVVIQSFMPHSGPIQFARRGDFDGFLAMELEQRKEFNYPPYRHLIRHIFRGPDAREVQRAIEAWTALIEKSGLEGVELRGPVAAPLERVKGHYRYHLWIFTKSVTRVLPELLKLKENLKLKKDIIEIIDVDPIDMH